MPDRIRMHQAHPLQSYGKWLINHGDFYINKLIAKLHQPGRTQGVKLAFDLVATPQIQWSGASKAKRLGVLGFSHELG